MGRKLKLIAPVLLLLTFLSTPAHSVEHLISAKAKSKSTVTEVSIFESEPKDGFQIRVSTSSGLTAKFKRNEKIQIVFNGMSPNSPVASVVVNPKGLSKNLPGSNADGTGKVLLPYLSIAKAGDYSILVRQPEGNKSIYIRLKVI